MSGLIDIKVPDIGDFKDVPVIEIFVKPGDKVKAEDPLVALESDKATMEVPSPRDGERGDLVVEVRIMLPKVLDERSKELLREFGRINGR